MWLSLACVTNYIHKGCTTASSKFCTSCQDVFHTIQNCISQESSPGPPARQAGKHSTTEPLMPGPSLGEHFSELYGLHYMLSIVLKLEFNLLRLGVNVHVAVPTTGCIFCYLPFSINARSRWVTTHTHTHKHTHTHTHTRARAHTHTNTHVHKHNQKSTQKQTNTLHGL